MRQQGPAAARWLPAAAVMLASCTPAAPAPHALPFDPLPAEAESEDAPVVAEDRTVEGTERRARWGEPPAPRVVAEWSVEGALRAPVVVRPGECPVRRASDCACQGDLVLAASTAGVLTAFDPDGRALWEADCGAPVTQAPAAPPGQAIFLRCDDGALLALDPVDGRERWRISRPAAYGLVTSVEWSPWAGMLFAGDDGMAAVDASGAVAWSRPEPGPFSGRPALSGRVIVFGGLDRIVRGLDAQTGEELWRRWVVGGVEGGVLELGSSDVVVATLYGHVHAFGLPAGTPRWETVVGTLARGLPAEGTDGTILVGLMDGALVGLDPRDGAVAWGLGIPAPVLAQPLAIARTAGASEGAGRPRAHAVLGDRAGFLAEVSYRALRGDAADESGLPAAATGPREEWRFNVGLPIEGRPALQGASLLLGLEDGRLLRILPGEVRCGEEE